MKKILLSLLAIIVISACSLLLEPVRIWLVELSLPHYPDWPAPVRSLNKDNNGEIYYATSSPYDLEVILGDMTLAKPTTGLGYLSYPKGVSSAAPVPAMIILPGSGGISPGREREYAQWFNQQGIAAFIVEYYAPRGFDNDSNYLIRTSSVTEFDLIADAYRPCFQDLQSTDITQAPLLTLRGTEDASNDLAACARREDELRALGASVTAHIYPGAGHAWEDDKTRDQGYRDIQAFIQHVWP